MAYVSALLHNVFLVRWKNPRRGDAGAVLNEIRHAHQNRQSEKVPLVYIAVVPQTTQPPDEETRREMTDAIPLTLEFCERVYVVIEGTGLKHAMMRSIATGMFMVTGKRGKVSIYSTLLEALQAAPLAASAATILKAAENEGISAA